MQIRKEQRDWCTRTSQCLEGLCYHGLDRSWCRSLGVYVGSKWIKLRRWRN